MRALKTYRRNPDYGSGAFRRRIRLIHRAGAVLGMLDDNNHAIWVRLRHAEGAITAISGGFHRWPTTGCVDAEIPLQSLVGMSAATPLSELYHGLPLLNCTHMFDLAVMTMRHAGRPEGRRVWDAVVPDAPQDALVASVELDGALVHRWKLSGDIIMEPAALAGQSVVRRFLPWAQAHFTGDALEGALMLRMAVFVSLARRYVTDDRDRPLADFPERHGVCHAYSSPRFERSIQRAGAVVDQSNGVVEQPEPRFSW
ncbi:hypothetical protein ACFSCW_06475 [Sphingomonas tabacisoli]|uniref:DUF2889 domain-containing protein n=1 Tax=Sphingomonas tabacisoli TaxID=2249466 RepID=A0ABW4I0J3_9SPHN